MKDQIRKALKSGEITINDLKEIGAENGFNVVRNMFVRIAKIADETGYDGHEVQLPMTKRVW